MMLRRLLNISVLFVALANASPLAKLDSKIVGGANTDIKDHPYQVSLEYYGLHICGGTLFGLTKIITAAHCVSNVVEERLYVRVGTSERNVGGNLLKVTSIKAHEDFQIDPVVQNDIAVLTLAEDVPAGNVGKGIECFAHDRWLFDGSGTITGWGYEAENGDLAAKLNAVDIPFVKRKDCQDIYKDKLAVSMFCAGEEDKDACHGDSGGPLVQPNKEGVMCLVGIVSWGDGCAQKDKPRVLTSIPKLNKWLQKELSIDQKIPNRSSLTSSEFNLLKNFTIY